MEPTFIYYEVNRGVYQVMEEGAVLDFPNFSALKSFYFSPDQSFVFVQVTPENWQQLYDDGVFFS